MFSWGSNAINSRRQNYPANRTSEGAAAVTVAPTIQGSIRPPEYTRAQHLDSYLQDDMLKRSTRRVSADDSTYDTVFQTVSGDTLILRVHLPASPHPSAPVRAPAMTLAGVKARHAWLDQRMRVTGYAPAQSDDHWRDARTLLGAAVHSVVKHFQLDPPEVLEITDSGLRAIQQPKKNGSSNGHNQRPPPPAAASSTATPAGPKQQFPNQPPQVNAALHYGSGATDAPPDYETLLQVPEMDMPAIPSHFDQLDNLSREELDRLLEDELHFMAFCNKLPTMRTLQEMATSTVEENAEQAKKNLEHEEELKSLYEEVTGLQREVKDNVKAFRELEKKQDAICAPPDERRVLRELAKAKKEAFDESEEIANDWLDGGGGDVVAFVKSFVDKRKVHHVRAAKMEMLQLDGGKSV